MGWNRKCIWRYNFRNVLLETACSNQQEKNIWVATVVWRSLKLDLFCNELFSAVYLHNI